MRTTTELAKQVFELFGCTFVVRLHRFLKKFLSAFIVPLKGPSISISLCARSRFNRSHLDSNFETCSVAAASAIPFTADLTLYLLAEYVYRRYREVSDGVIQYDGQQNGSLQHTGRLTITSWRSH